MQRLGKNTGSYLGDRIDIDGVLASVLLAARQNDWEEERLTVSERLELLALRRIPTQARKTIYISTGIHGDEPAGPLAVQQLLAEDPWPPDIAIWLCPCLNPEGFRQNRRENEDAVDLNRDYRHLATATVRAHVAWLERRPRFDLALCLHEDWESNGFYVYELNPDGRESLAELIVRRVAAVCPIDLSPIIEGRDARGGIIRPDIDPDTRPQWAESFYLIQNKTRQSYTLEAPSDFPLATRMAALVEGVKAVLERL
jgi:predicted deacylase